jgi:hypothetical protein
MMEIVERYEGATTASGRQIRVDRRPGEIDLWYFQPGERDGGPGRHHMGIARVQKQAGVYLVGCLRGSEERAYENHAYWDIGEVFRSLDEVIASR